MNQLKSEVLSDASDEIISPLLGTALASATLLLAACGGGGGGGAGAGAGGATNSSGGVPNVVGGTDPTVVGGGGTNSTATTPPSSLPFAPIKPSSEAEAARFLAQAGFGGDAKARQSLMQNGFESWLKAQFAMPQGVARWDEISALKIADPAAYSVTNQQIDNMLWKRIVSYPDVLRQRMTLALSELFVVNSGGVDVPAKAHAMCAYMDLLEKNAFGNFRQLLEAVTLHPAMGRMLGTLGNRKEDAKTGRRPDENYAREVMQLFTIGLYELNPDGSNRLVNGKEAETYNQDMVSNLARVFTGWSTTLDWVSGNPDANLMRQPMVLNATSHSLLEKKFLGVTIPAGTNGTESLKTALDTLFNHPNVGPFIGKQLIQRFVTSNPSPAYISRIAAVFANNGQGQRGDLKAVLQAILLDTEARQSSSSAFAGKWIEPMIRVGIVIRSLGFTSPDGQWRLTQANVFGQQPLNAPSVFNFFRPAYVPPNSSLVGQSKSAPELQIVSEQSVLIQANSYASLLDDPQSFTRRNYYDAAKKYIQDDKATGLSLDLAVEIALASQADALVAHLNLLLGAGQLSSTTQQFIIISVSKMPATDTDPAKLKTKLINRVKAAILMVLVAPDSQLLK
ncbi:DUF1800 domain-containing protein [Deefgea rivuli]|uniref:DUF1800 domain-containing protein n=1 Tax=Deefgea rivuli TaxID=400948 RepID=UPI0012EBF499|nr:DUF1800 domain-containing protein [Deefgea rivuli]